MNATLLLVGYILSLVVLQITVYCKRVRKMPYDRKVLLAVSFYLIAAVSTHFFLKEPIGPNSSYQDKIIYAIWAITGVNAILQFFAWIIYSATIRRNIIRLPRFVFDILTFVFVTIFVYIFIKQTFGLENLSGILVTSTVLSAVIGLALQDTLSNLIAGISLQIESPFSLGEWVNLGGFEGKIVSQNWRTLTIETRESHRISLTNKFVAEDKIVNFSKPTQRQIHNFYIVLDYSHPPNQIKTLLNRLLDEMDEVVKDEKLGTFVVGYEDYGIKYCMRYWLYDYADILYIQDKVLTRLWYILRRHHIKIPYPIHELHLENDFSHRQEEELMEMRAQWHEQLRHVELLKDLEEEQLQFLAENIEMQLFAKNDPLVKQGDEGDSMYLILSGTADVYLENEKKRIFVAQKQKGEFFGEMSLLTGEPRSATLIAKNDMLTAIINKVKFSEILMKDERILDKLLSALEENKSDLSELMEKAKIDQKTQDGSARKQLVKYIKNYLGLIE